MKAPLRFARLFDAQYRDFDSDLALWLELARRSGDPVLELGCGSGRVLLPLAQAGHAVVGIDHDADMLAIAQERLAAAEPEFFELVRAELTEFRLEKRFKFALAPLNTLATLDDHAFRKTVTRAAEHLDPGATLAFDLPNPATALEEDADPDEILDAFIEPASGCAVQVRASLTALENAAMQRVTWVYEVLRADGEVEPVNYEQIFYLRDVKRLELLAESSGVALGEILGDYDGSMFSSESPRLIAIFHRRD
jgi:SAM-dependent methyltransferase